MNLSPAPAVLPGRVYPPDSFEFFQTGSVPLRVSPPETFRVPVVPAIHSSN